MSKTKESDPLVKQEPEERKTSYLWIVHALASGLTFALGNVVFGINCSQNGVYGGGFPGPASLLMVGLYKFYAQC